VSSVARRRGGRAWSQLVTKRKCKGARQRRSARAIVERGTRANGSSGASEVVSRVVADGECIPFGSEALVDRARGHVRGERVGTRNIKITGLRGAMRDWDSL
jgi:hypothetical protein